MYGFLLLLLSILTCGPFRLVRHIFVCPVFFLKDKVNKMPWRGWLSTVCYWMIPSPLRGEGQCYIFDALLCFAFKYVKCYLLFACRFASLLSCLFLFVCLFICLINQLTKWLMIKLQMQNKHKTTHDRHLTGVHWPINRGRVWGSRGGRGGRASTGGPRWGAGRGAEAIVHITARGLGSIINDSIRPGIN